MKITTIKPIQIRNHAFSLFCQPWKFFVALSIYLVSFQFSIKAQVPQKFSYQSIIRMPGGQPLTNQLVGIRLSILQGSEAGSAVFVETHSASSNAFGLVSIPVGGGTLVSGSFSGIDWSAGSYYIKTETDTEGGNNYSITGTSQLLSVPFALYSANNTPGPQGPVGASGSGGFKHYIGERFGGGIVFHVYRDTDGTEQGLVVSLSNQSNNAIWSNFEATEGASSDIDGLLNCEQIVAHPQHINSAAKLCLDYSSEGFSDWYLPSKYELKALFDNILVVNKALFNIDNSMMIFVSNNWNNYWSSSQVGTTTAWSIDLYGNFLLSTFNSQADVRAIRAYSVPANISTVTDIDGNIYNSITIGNQVWMKENLKVSKYRNGNPIPTNLSDAEWQNTSNGAYSINNNDTTNNKIYGKLYNWYAVADPRGLCPEGWHVPTDAEWFTLENQIDPSINIASELGFRGLEAGGKMKSISSLWNNPNSGATNSSGFTGLPGGVRENPGNFNIPGGWGYWWSSSDNSTTTAWYRFLDYMNSSIYRQFDYDKSAGFSVRCVKD